MLLTWDEKFIPEGGIPPGAPGQGGYKVYYHPFLVASANGLLTDLSTGPNRAASNACAAAVSVSGKRCHKYQQSFDEALERLLRAPTTSNEEIKKKVRKKKNKKVLAWDKYSYPLNGLSFLTKTHC